MENIIILNPENVEDIKKQIVSEGKDKFHVLSYFDGTLTYHHDINGKIYPSLISVLREGDYISYMARCSIHKYYREVKRRAEPEAMERYDMPPLITQKLEEYKEIIRQIINEKLQSLMRGE